MNCCRICFWWESGGGKLTKMASLCHFVWIPHCGMHHFLMFFNGDLAYKIFNSRIHCSLEHKKLHIIFDDFLRKICNACAIAWIRRRHIFTMVECFIFIRSLWRILLIFIDDSLLWVLLTHRDVLFYLSAIRYCLVWWWFVAVSVVYK